ncbi:MAG: hypothetical protein O3A00_11260 [Planctomycetota bacterium]|nr:hypothetical protein [Planctomycetota bacterium]
MPIGTADKIYQPVRIPLVSMPASGASQEPTDLGISKVFCHASKQNAGVNAAGAFDHDFKTRAIARSRSTLGSVALDWVCCGDQLVTVNAYKLPMFEKERLFQTHQFALSFGYILIIPLNRFRFLDPPFHVRYFDLLGMSEEY